MTTNIKEMLSNIGPNKLHTENGYEFFKLDSDGYYYALNTETGRATRFNGEIQNGKRISIDAYEAARDMLECEIEEALEREAELDDTAENPDISVEEFAQMVSDYEESATTEEVKEIAKELAPKAKKTRRPKDVAFEADIDGKHITLTAKQLDFMGHLKDTCFWERGLESCPWIDCLCDDIGGQFAGKPMTVGAMVSTLCEKGLANRARAKVNGHTATYMSLTELGQKVAVVAKLGLE